MLMFNLNPVGANLPKKACNLFFRDFTELLTDDGLPSTVMFVTD